MEKGNNMSEENTGTVESVESVDDTNSFVDGTDGWENIEVPDDFEASAEESEPSDDKWDDVEVPEDLETSPEASKKVEGAEPEEKEVEEASKKEEKVGESSKESKVEAKEENPDKNLTEVSSETIKDKTFKVKVDGKEVELTGQELLNRASGDIAVEKRLGDLDKEKKEFYSEKSAVEAYIKEFGSKVKDGNILGGLEYFGQFANLPSHVLKEQLIAALAPEIEARTYMTPDELRNHKLKAENEYLAQKNESDTKRIAQEQAQNAEMQAKREFEQHINSLKETHSITEQEWDLAFTQLDSELPKDQAITPEMVIEKAGGIRTETQTSNRVKSIVKTYEGELNDTFIKDLKKVAMENPDLSDDDIKTIIEDSLKLHKEQQLKARLNEKSAKTTKSAPSDKVEDDEFDLSNFLEEDGW